MCLAYVGRLVILLIYLNKSAFVPIAECYVPNVQGLMQNYYRVGGLTGSSLSIPTGYILPSSDPTFALLLVGFTEYDDDDDDLNK
ncbi:hypothetical protein Hanom_Chr13g01212521 [Helianthus anomalus]